MAKVTDLLPEITGNEMMHVQSILQNYDDEKGRSFANIYRARRKDPQIVLVTALLGFIVVAGVHRFLLNQIGMGLLYLFTGGLCLIGTIIDLVNYQQLAFEYNRQVADEVAVMTR